MPFIYIGMAIKGEQTRMIKKFKKEVGIYIKSKETSQEYMRDFQTYPYFWLNSLINL